MNTTEYGETFELKVRDFVKRIVANDEMPGASSKRSRVFHHKCYPTASGRSIIADVTIETYISEENELNGIWSTLIVFECKRYKNTVDIGDLDEFESKLRKIGGLGVKGYFVTTSRFSLNALNEARKLHYGLVIFDENNNWKWEVPRDTRRGKNEEYVPVFLGESAVGTSPLVFDNGCFLNFIDLLNSNDVCLSHSRKLKAPYLPKDRIIEIASKIYTENPGIDSDIAGCLVTRLFPQFHICFENLPYRVEGRTSIKEQKIILSNSLISNENRLRFTLAHELGHLVLHSELLAASEGLLDNIPHPLPESELKWIDVQANQFASAILMPILRFNSRVLAIYQTLGIHNGKLILDNQPCKASMLHSILVHLSSEFMVSKEAVTIRLKNDGYLVDMRKTPKRIGNILKGY